MDTFRANQTKLIEQAAQELMKDETVKPPAWAAFVKTSPARERPPANDNWWHIRAASILRKVHLLGPIGTAKLKHHYGGKKNRGAKPEKHYEGSGAIIRKILQQCEAAGYLKQEKKGAHKGRVLTPKGQKLLAQAAKEAN